MRSTLIMTMQGNIFQTVLIVEMDSIGKFDRNISFVCCDLCCNAPWIVTGLKEHLFIKLPGVAFITKMILFFLKSLDQQ